MNQKRLTALALSLTLLCACTPKTPDPTPEPTPTAVPTAEPTAAPQGQEVRVAMLKGPTGLGCARLIEESVEGRAEGRYTFTVCAEPTEAVAKLTGKEVDIAALPTNLAAALYHKTDGGVQLLALNTYGVLYILENGESIQELTDLEGRTIHAYGQGANPEFVLNYLLEQNELVPGEDVSIEWHASTDEVAALMAVEEGEVCMLPVPAATGLLMKSEKTRSALDLTQEWEKAQADGVLTMGCVVVRSEFAKAHPEAVDTFLKEYGDSIAYMSDEANLTEAAALAEKWSIVPKAAVAEKALPQANLCFVTGDDMMDGIQGYYQVLFQADPAAIGGSIPDGAFYYMYHG